MGGWELETQNTGGTGEGRVKSGVSGAQREMEVFLAAKWIKSGSEDGLGFLPPL